MPVFLLPFIAGAKSFLGAAMTFFSRPPGSWIGAAILLGLGLWWFGQHEYNAGAAANEARHVAATAIVAHRIEIANIGFAADVKASTDRALADLSAGVQHLSDLLSNQQSEISHAFAASNIDARYPVPCIVVRAHDEAVLAAAAADVVSDACGADDAAAPTKASALSAALLNDGEYTHVIEQHLKAAIADDEGVRAAYGKWRDEVIAAMPKN